jgi:hypothetical protein
MENFMENFNSLEWLQQQVEEELATEKELKRKARNKRKALKRKIKQEQSARKKQGRMILCQAHNLSNQ